MSVAAQSSLYELEAERRTLLEELEAGGGVLTPEMEAKWNELDAAILEKCDAYGWTLKRLEKESELYRDRAMTLIAMARARESMIERLKDRMAGYLFERGLKKMAGTDFTITLRESEQVVTDPLVSLPAEYVRVRTEPNKEAIKKALKEGIPLSGASLVKHLYVTVK